MQTFILILLFGLIAEICGTIAGFGSSSIFLPLVSQLLDFKNALILVAIYHIFGNASRLFYFHKNISWKIFFLFGIPSVVTTIIGASLAEHIDQNKLKMGLGVVLFFFALFSLINPNLKVKISNKFGIIGGGLSGFTAGLIGTGGVLRGAFMSLFQLPKEQYIGTIACVALLVDFTRIPIYFSSGFLDQKYLVLIPFLFVIALVGSYIGKKIISHFSDVLFRRVILIGIMILSSVFFLQGFQYI